MVRLFINVGKKDKIKPGDILGAIAGESGMPGRLGGAIDMYDKYTFVEVPAEMCIRDRCSTWALGRTSRQCWNTCHRSIRQYSSRQQCQSLFWKLQENISMMPVSYTHLDVYKRQALYYCP